MSIITRELLLAAKDSLPRETKTVEELGGEVIIRGLTSAERDDFEISVGKYGPANMRARLVVKCMINEEGGRVLEDSDADALGQLAGTIVDSLFDVASRLSGMDQADVEDMEKN